MKKEITTAPENSVIFIMDKTIGEIPESIGKSLIAATPSCIAVGTLCSIDGETRITLSDEQIAIDNKKFSGFIGTLDTPAQKIAVCTVLNQSVLEMDVNKLQVGIQIWVNDPSEPSEIDIIVSGT